MVTAREGGRVSPASSGKRLGMLLRVLQHTGQMPTSKVMWPQCHSMGSGNPGLRVPKAPPPPPSSTLRGLCGLVTLSNMVRQFTWRDLGLWSAIAL